MNILPKINLRKNLGFTLVELLVVIGILGILAAALIATIDPFEQIRKTNDSDVKNTAVEYLNASTRYYATHTALPWDTSANGGNDNCNALNTVTFSSILISAMGACTTALIDDGELKSTITSSTNLSKLFVSSTATGEVSVCFKPLSKSGQKDLLAKYDSDGTTTSSCVVGSGDCYWCAR